MYLSRLILNLRSRAVQQDLSDCRRLHRTVMSAFPDEAGDGDPRSRLGVLYRLDTHPRTGQVTLLVQSSVVPDWSRLMPGYLWDTGGDPPNPAGKAVDEQYGRLREGMALSFRLLANPTRKIDTRSGPDGQRRNGRRVELREEQAQIEWLKRKGDQGGFQLLGVRVRPAVPGGKISGGREHEKPGPEGKGPGRLTFGAVLFEGQLLVTDEERFRAALAQGIGPGKAYGFGLLSVAPPRE